VKTGLHQHVGLRQDLRMNPRLYQAMDLLYLPLLDLQQHLKQELEANPFLELAEEEETELEQTEKKTKEEESNGELKDESDWERLLVEGFDDGAPRGLPTTSSDEEFRERVPVESKDLGDHLREQLHMLDLSPRQRLLAEEFLGNIAEDGYLGATLEEIVAGANQVLDEARAAREDGDTDDVPSFTVAEAEPMLQTIQALDPPGVGARDLRECLLLQMRARKQTETIAYRLVHDAFDDLIAHRWSDIAKRFDLDPREIQAAADELAKLDPKPGLQYSAAPDPYVVPDLVVEKVDDQYLVYLNEHGVPRLRLSKTYQEVARDRKKFQGENKEFIADRMNKAQWMLQAIEQRRQTMLKVMNFIVDRQREFFEKGIEYLKPLTLREVADVINMHESTVSRVTNGKYVQTPRGVFPLKFFFSSGLTTATGEDASARSVKAQIQKLIADEDPKQPLTDQEIVEEFGKRGVKIARRTVAKYRDQLGVLPARMRKRV
jgi:RNA polymerase sigma-54 factor